MTQTVHYRYHSLEDFLISKEVNVNCQFNDGWGGYYPVKGREIEATILFADISAFSTRTEKLTSTETLAFANQFFSWMTAEALRFNTGIVDKYIGDEMMVVFSKEFGSEDPFLDAVRAASRMIENDACGFYPHIGIASGEVTVGYVGTPMRFNCSVFGRPVTIASRCASHRPTVGENNIYSSYMVFPESEWAGRNFREVFNRKRETFSDDTEEVETSLELLPPEKVSLKNISEMKIRPVISSGFRIMSFSVEESLRQALRKMHDQKQYFPFGKEARQVVKATEINQSDSGFIVM